MTVALLTAIFWFGLAVTLYVYVGFPLLMSCLARDRQKPESMAPADAPPVTVIIPAYNEEQNIEAKIRNVLGSAYPHGLLDIIVVSDASTDRTDEIVRGFSNEGVRLLVQATRRGKTDGLNLAMAIARGDIVMFTDANALCPEGTIRTLVEYFQDARVGLVTGYTKYRVTESGEIADATNAYTALERTIKRAESRWGCCVGADGAIFAMRRSLYRPLRYDDINDFVLPLTVIEQGSDCLLADDVYCSENPGKNLESEFRRQSRITNRSLRAIRRHAGLLDPVRFPFFAFFLISHKVMRFLAPVFLVASAVSLVVLAQQGRLYLAMGAAASLAAVVMAAAWAKPELASSRFPWGSPIKFLNVFVVLNAAMLHGWWKFLSGNAEVTWQHDRAVSR